MRKLNQLNREHVWSASILLFFVLGCLVMKSCIWDEIQANQPAQQTEQDMWNPFSQMDALEKEINALAHEITALQEEIEKDIEDLRLIESYLTGLGR